MTDDRAPLAGGSFSLSQRQAAGGLVVSLTGDLAIAHVEMLAECADRICGMPARSVRFELDGLAAVDEAGARTLAAACHCLRLYGRQVEVRGMGQEVRRVVTGLGLALPETARPGPALPEMTRPQTARLETARLETARLETARPEVGRPELARPRGTAPRRGGRAARRAS